MDIRLPCCGFVNILGIDGPYYLSSIHIRIKHTSTYLLYMNIRISYAYGTYKIHIRINIVKYREDGEYFPVWKMPMEKNKKWHSNFISFNRIYDNVFRISNRWIVTFIFMIRMERANKLFLMSALNENSEWSVYTYQSGRTMTNSMETYYSAFDVSAISMAKFECQSSNIFHPILSRRLHTHLTIYKVRTTTEL